MRNRGSEEVKRERAEGNKKGREKEKNGVRKVVALLSGVRL